MPERTVYLITGTNRGIGLALAAKLLLRPHHTIIATTRSPSTPPSLSGLPHDGTSILVHAQLSTPSSPNATSNPAVSALEAVSSTHPEITHIDVVIANAGMAPPRASTLSLQVENLLSSISVNTLAPLQLFQASWALLQNSQNPKFILIGSVVGSVAGVEQTGGWANPAYGVAKAAGHYLVRKLGKENEGKLAVAVIHPGWARTDLGNKSAVEQGLKEAPVSLKESVDGILEEIGKMEKGKDAGFRTFDHKDIAW